MKLRVRLALATPLLLAAAIACSSERPEAASDGTWVGTITTEGNVTTVVNESGSVWGGTARLVEEASIGVEAGQDPYMFGQLVGVVAGEQRIYVLDGQVPALRMYDFDGHHIADIGGVGSGPGEFREPDALGIADDGRLFVRDGGQGRVVVYSAAGETIDTWSPQVNIRTNRPMAVTRAGEYYEPFVIERADDILEWKMGMQQFGPDGPIGEPIPVPEFPFDRAQLEARAGRSMMAMDIPFYPDLHWTLTPTGAMVAGTSDAYSFEIHEPTGGVIRVSKNWDPVPAPTEANGLLRRRIVEQMRGMDPDWSWDGPDIPSNKPAFSQIVPDRDGRVWIRSIVGTRHDEDCDPEERGSFCWPDVTAVDVFAADGRYLGRLDRPPGFGLDQQTFIAGEVVIDAIVDDAGTIMVKRYRLVLPGEEGQ